MLKLLSEGTSEVTERYGFIKVAVWGETDDLLQSHDHFVSIINFTHILKPIPEGISSY